LAAPIVSAETLEHFIWRKRYFVEDNATPLFHYRMINHYLSEGSYIKPIKAFRGSAKSTNTCYMALYRAYKQLSRYTLIVSDTTTQAEALIADISTMVQESSLPITVVRDVTGEIEFEVYGVSYYIVGKGAGSSMRGIKRGRQRPDTIILDDIINDELVMNRLRVDRLNRWFYKALLPSLAPDGHIYAVGTPLSQGDLFMHLCSLHETISIPLAAGVWNDRFSPEWIAAKKEEYTRAGMLREYKQEFELVLTDSETALFDMKRIKYCDPDDVPENLTWYMTLDGAFSEQTSADFSAFSLLGVDRHGNWFVESVSMKAKPTEVVSKLFELQDKCSALDIGIEKGAWLLSMKSEVDDKMLDYQQYFNVVELNTNGSKISRIKALTHIINSGRLTIIDNGENAEMLVEQLELTDDLACNAKHDDALDSMAQLLQLDIISSDGNLDDALTEEAFEDEMSQFPQELME